MIAVWFDMLGSDDRSRWPAELLTDSRVTHFWDTDKRVGTWYGENVTVQEPGHVEWDMFFLYDRGVEWTEGHSGIFASGRTIWARREQLSRDVATLVGAPGAGLGRTSLPNLTAALRLQRRRRE